MLPSAIPNNRRCTLTNRLSERTQGRRIAGVAVYQLLGERLDCACDLLSEYLDPSNRGGGGQADHLREALPVPLHDVGAAEVTKQSRYNELLLLVGYTLVSGVAYTASLFSNAAAFIIFFPGVGCLALWWFFSRDTVVRVMMGKTRVGGVVARGQRTKPLAFLNDFKEVEEEEA